MSIDLIRAVMNADIDNVRAALAAGASPDQMSSSQTPALHYAAWRNSSLMVTMLLNAGADPNLKSPDGGTALLRAVAHQNDDVAKLLLAAGADVRATYTDDDTTNALMIAARHGSLPIIRLLVANGLDARYRSKFGVTALHFASIDKDQPDIVLELINLGADLNAKTKSGHTPLKYAESLDREKNCKVLRDFGTIL